MSDEINSVANMIESKVAEALEENTGEHSKRNAAECVIWKLDHSNCKGCDSEFICLKETALICVVLASGDVFKHMGFRGLILCLPTFHRKIQEIYKSTNFEELDKIMREGENETK